MHHNPQRNRLRLCLYQPDIPQNTATLLRLCACLNVRIDIIEPCGFIWSDKRLRRVGMDYLDHVTVFRHPSWSAFINDIGKKRRLILLTRHAKVAYTDFQFQDGDALLLGRESRGVPSEVVDKATATLGIPMAEGMRSLNVAVAGAMALGEALRQTDQWPGGSNHHA